MSDGKQGQRSPQKTPHGLVSPTEIGEAVGGPYAERVVRVSGSLIY